MQTLKKVENIISERNQLKLQLDVQQKYIAELEKERDQLKSELEKIERLVDNDINVKAKLRTAVHNVGKNLKTFHLNDLYKECKESTDAEDWQASIRDATNMLTNTGIFIRLDKGNYQYNTQIMH